MTGRRQDCQPLMFQGVNESREFVLNLTPVAKKLIKGQWFQHSGERDP
jgi:hypothetical protein